MYKFCVVWLCNCQMSEAVERAKLRREEEERKNVSEKDKVRENLKMVEERLAERRKAEASKVS